MNAKKIFTTGLIFFVATLIVLAIATKPESGEFSFASVLDLKDGYVSLTEIEMNAGTLDLTTHSEPSLALNAQYTREAWKPEMILNEESGLLSIHQPSQKSTNMKSDDENKWEIKFPSMLETDLKLTIGAGEGNIDLAGTKIKKMTVEAGAGDFDINLSNTSLSQLDISAGVGELKLDLSGERKKSLTAEINGGVGALTVILPHETGIRIKANAGLGSINAQGLKKQNGYYTNEAYGNTSQSIEMEVNGGLGSIDLKLQ